MLFLMRYILEFGALPQNLARCIYLWYTQINGNISRFIYKTSFTLNNLLHVLFYFFLVSEERVC